MNLKLLIFLAPLLLLNAVHASGQMNISASNITTISLPMNMIITGILSDNLNGQVYVVDSPYIVSPNTTYLYDINDSTLAVNGKILLPGLQPDIPVLDPASGNIYVLDEGYTSSGRGHTVDVVNTTTFSVSGTIPVHAGATGLGIANVNGEKLLYVLTAYQDDIYNSNTLYAVSASNGTVVKAIPIPTPMSGGPLPFIPSSVFSTTSGKFVYVFSWTQGSGYLFKISTINNSIVSQGYVSNLGISAILSWIMNDNGTQLYTAVSGSYGTPSSNTSVVWGNTTVKIGKGWPPELIGLDEVRGLLYVLSPADTPAVSVVDVNHARLLVNWILPNRTIVDDGAFAQLTDRLFITGSNGTVAPNKIFVLDGYNYSQPKQVSSVTTIAYTTSTQPQPSSGSSNTALYVGAAIVIVVIVVAALLLRRGRDGSPPEPAQPPESVY